MKKNKEKKRIRVFSRNRHVSNNCFVCKKRMVYLEKVFGNETKTGNVISICKNTNCSQKVDLNGLKKSGWRLKNG